MKYVSYNKELLTAQAEMVRLFSNISIYNPSKKQNELVPCVFGQSSRIFKSLVNPSAAPVEYPIISIERGHLSIDLPRNHEIHHDTRVIGNPANYNPNLRPPTPINIEFVVRMFTKYPEQSDMIVSNFIPFYNKDVFVRTPHPKINGKVLPHQVIWNGNVKYDWKSTLQNTDQDIQMAETSFTYRTELFGGTEFVTGEMAEGKIYTINMSLSPSDGSIYPKFDEKNPDGNILGGFFGVPYSEDFDKYAESLVDDYIIHGSQNIDTYLVTNAFNCKFNSAIKNNDIESLKEAVNNGANIYKLSYWPYYYANLKKYKEITDWLKDNGALIPEPGKEHIISGKDIQVAGLE